MTTAKANGVTKALPRKKAKLTKAVKVRGIYEAWGGEFRVIRPNELIGMKVMSTEDIKEMTGADLAMMDLYLQSFIHPDDRAKFVTAALADPTLDGDKLTEVMTDLSELAYADA